MTAPDFRTNKRLEKEMRQKAAAIGRGERVTVSKQDRDWVAECVAHEWFVYASDQPLAYELAAGHVCMEHPKQPPPSPGSRELFPNPVDTRPVRRMTWWGWQGFNR